MTLRPPLSNKERGAIWVAMPRRLLLMLSEALTLLIRSQIAQSPVTSDLALDGWLLRRLFVDEWTPEQWQAAGFLPSHVKQIRAYFGLSAKRDTRITYHAITKTAAAWLASCEHHPSVTPHVFTMRARAGWTLHRALTTPRRKKTYEKTQQAH